jgi:type I restriction enzyme S subunit
MSIKKIKFGDLFEYENKSRIKAGNGLLEGEYPFYTSSSVLSKFLGEYTFDKTSLIFGTGGNASIHYCESPFSVSTDCLVAFAKDENICFPKFVFYYLYGNINLLEEGFKGAGLKHISKGFINDLEIPLPPLPIQKRIAEILDAADAIKRKDQALLKKYDELAQAIFIDMFGDPVKNEKGWEVKTIEELTSFIDYRGKTPERSKTEEVPLITAKNVKFGFYDFSEKDFVTLDKYNEIMTRGFPKVGDVLFTTEGATLGNVCRIPDLPKFAIGQRLISMSGDKVTSEYLQYILCSDFFQDQVYKYATGSAVKGIRSAVLKKLIIPVPKYDVQLKFTSAIQSIEIQIRNATKSNEKSKNIFSTLIQKAFNGELFSI